MPWFIWIIPRVHTVEEGCQMLATTVELPSVDGYESVSCIGCSLIQTPLIDVFINIMLGERRRVLIGQAAALFRRR